MFVNKIGKQHLDIGMNCQDYGLEDYKNKLVCDGCSEGLHTEVGAKIYSHLAKRGYSTHEIFDKLIEIFGDNSKSVKDYLCFTILDLVETDDTFELDYCGDGYVILQDIDGNVHFEELSDGEYPKYFAYNYVDSNVLKYYKDGVELNKKQYSKELYLNVGVATDGIRFMVNNDDEDLKNEFVSILKSGKSIKMKRFINKHQNIFKDDTTIVF